MRKNNRKQRITIMTLASALALSLITLCGCEKAENAANNAADTVETVEEVETVETVDTAPVTQETETTLEPETAFSDSTEPEEDGGAVLYEEDLQYFKEILASGLEQSSSENSFGYYDEDTYEGIMVYDAQFCFADLNGDGRKDLVVDGDVGTYHNRASMVCYNLDGKMVVQSFGGIENLLTDGFLTFTEWYEINSEEEDEILYPHYELVVFDRDKKSFVVLMTAEEPESLNNGPLESEYKYYKGDEEITAQEYDEEVYSREEIEDVEWISFSKEAVDSL